MVTWIQKTKLTGVPVAKFYKPAEGRFTCISVPSKTIPFSQVNDDYCDCPDGSDEPGTAACSYLSPLSPPQPPFNSDALSIPHNSTLALPGFYCKNKGHIPAYLRFENVNDGKCDYDVCCDGSDEYGHVGGVKCEDRCKEIGKEWKKSEELRLKALRGAVKRRRELIVEADKAKREVEIKIEDLKIKLHGLEIKVKEAQDALRDTERREKLRVVKAGAGRQGKTGVLLGLAKGRVEELRKSLDKTMTQRNNMLSRVEELEKMLSKLKEEHNPNFNDEGVKQAVRGWEDYAARDTDDGWEEAEDRDLEAVLKEDGAESGINWADFESEDAADDTSDVAALYQITAYFPPSLRNWIDDRITSFKQLLVESGVLPEKSSSDASSTESKAVTDAKKFLSDQERELSNTKNEITRTEEDLTKDYGPDGIFRALKNTCISKDSGEYTYEICFMERTKQKPKKGGGDTNMGNFVGFDTEIVDEEVSGDGKGLGKGKRIVMKYENGQHCWNGPNRSTRVVLACSEKDELWKVSESEKCVYRMEVGTAAVCEGNGNGNGDGNGKVKVEGKSEL